MKIGIIQASSQKDKNKLLYGYTSQAAVGHEVINFGCFEDEAGNFSYIETALEAGLLLGCGCVDIIVTGCSSGQGMMLALNSIPGVICGYTPTPQDAFLFAQINNGNAVSLPLGLGYGWCGELNLKMTLESLLSRPFGGGYPEKDAARKVNDTLLMKKMRRASQTDLFDFLHKLYSAEPELVRRSLSRGRISTYLKENASEEAMTGLREWIF